MPALVRRYLKTSIAFLILGMMLGLHVSAAEYLGLGWVRPGYIVAHTHMLLIGFLLMLIMGVALWMFPKPAEGDGRYRPERFEVLWWLVTAGVLLRATFEILGGYLAGRWIGIGVFSASVVESVAIALFFLGLWPRIRSPRDESRRRDAPG